MHSRLESWRIFQLSNWPCFTPKQGERTKNMRPQESSLRSNDKFDSNTTNKNDYTRKEGERAKNLKPQESSLRSNAPFDPNTTNKNDFTPKQSTTECDDAVEQTCPLSASLANPSNSELHESLAFLATFQRFNLFSGTCQKHATNRIVLAK